MYLEVIAGDKISPTVREEICSFLDRQDTSHPFQFPQWVGSFKGMGGGSLSCVWREANALVGYASCGVQRPAGSRVPLQALVTNRGPVCDDTRRWRETVNDLAFIAKRRQLMYIDAVPERVISGSEVSPFPSGWKSMGSERTSLRLDLVRGEEKIFAGFRKVARYEIRRAQRAGVRVTMAASAEEARMFLDIYFRLAKRKAFTTDDPEFMSEVLAWLRAEPGRGRLLLAWRDGVPLAGAVVVRAGRRCWYVWGASPECPNFSAGHVLQWDAIRWARASGCTEYDFGGYTPGAKSGPAWFKEGFGAEMVRLLPTHRLVLRKMHYRALQVARSVQRKLQRRQ